jgi:hypothetical protein
MEWSIIFKYLGSKIFSGRYVFGNITTPSRGNTGKICGKFFMISSIL